MLRGLLRLILVVLVLVGLGAFFLGYRWGGDGEGDASPITGVLDEVDSQRVREAASEISQTAAAGANEARRLASDGGLTAKIKAKMALDDHVKASAIDIDTKGTVVTLTGSVASAAERQRAVQLAKDTEGVTEVVDRLTVSE